MEIAVILVLVLVGLVIAAKLFATVMWLAGVVVSGLVIGALARAVLPGRQDMSLLHTFAYGLAGSLVGGGLAHLLHLGFILTWALQIGVAAALVAGREHLRLPRN